MDNLSIKSNQVDTLIITVGTRQVGWCCKDNVIRSFGADGNTSYPHHVNELYHELGIERGKYQENDKTYPWSARDIGKRYYEHCVEWLGGDFSQVALLLDQNIIETGIKQGLKHIILWGTDQPETVSWFFRRLDTLWLARLMEGKIKELYPSVRIDVHLPVIDAGDRHAIRQELELLILPEIAAFYDKDFTIWIQNKGCTPVIASGVEICAAALVRQCQVFNASPKEPEEFFPTLSNGSRTSSPSQSFELIPMGEYFWSLERLRVISAWERGDFTEAQLWLKVHQHRYPSLYKLASILALFTNWETDKFVAEIETWLNCNEVVNIAKSEEIQVWQKRLKAMKNKELTQALESVFLIELPFLRANYTAALMQFAQTLERLLYIQFTEHNWLEKGFVTIPPSKESFGDQYQPSFSDLIMGWCKYRKVGKENKYYKLLDKIRKQRNNSVHNAQSVTLPEICDLFSVQHTDEPMAVRDLMFDVLKQICPNLNIDQLLVRSLYQWGLNNLRTLS